MKTAVRLLEKSKHDAGTILRAVSYADCQTPSAAWKPSTSPPVLRTTVLQKKPFLQNTVSRYAAPRRATAFKASKSACAAGDFVDWKFRDALRARYRHECALLQRSLKLFSYVQL